MPQTRVPPPEGESQVVRDFKQWLETNDRGQAVAVGAICALTNLIKNSDASTIMELEIVLKDAQEQLQKVVWHFSSFQMTTQYIHSLKTVVSMQACCLLFCVFSSPALILLD